MDHAVIIHRGEPRRADVIAHDGDWAVTRYAADVSLTHLPTGARLPYGGTEAQLAAVLAELAQLPRFDLQTWEASRAGVKAVVKRHGLVRP